MARVSPIGLWLCSQLLSRYYTLFCSPLLTLAKVRLRAIPGTKYIYRGYGTGSAFLADNDIFMLFTKNPKILEFLDFWISYKFFVLFRLDRSRNSYIFI